MKYSEIIGLSEYFESYYDMTSEHGTYWRQFIPTERFYDILKTVIHSLQAQAAERKSFLIQGAYGTGKSHASAVVKHLLWDDSDTIEKYLSLNVFDNIQLKERVRNFRKTNRVFPVVLKGIENISDNRTFCLAIEKALKEALNKNNIEVQTQSDFEKMVVQIKNNQYIEWNKVISNQELMQYVTSIADLIRRLENRDIKILKILESILNKEGVHFSYSVIDKWLIEISKELSERGIASYLMIFWDEFTPFLHHQNRSEFLSVLQNIAELSKNNNVFLYVITHRTPEQAGLKDEEIKKVFDRFHIKDYSMEPITTYHIISAAIQKKNQAKWNELRDKFLSSNIQLNNLIDRLIDNQSSAAKSKLKDLFPIHPYTAYLATFIARNIGSTERSIFTFLNDEEKGFKKFLDNEINDSIPVITADLLWDYFIEEFEKDNSNKFAPVLDKFRLHIKNLDSAGAHYSAIFKGVLLLNALYRMVSGYETTKGLILPSESNIVSLFSGTIFQEHVTEALQFIDKKEMIKKTPDGLYLVAFSSLPIVEIEKEKSKLRSEYEDVTKVLEIDSLKKSLEDFVTNEVLRTTETAFYWAGEKEHILKSKLSKAFKKGYSLHLAICLLKEGSEESAFKNLLKNISKEEDFKNIIFLLSDKPFGEERFERFITYCAESLVAHNHNFHDDSTTAINFAKKVVEDWINNIKQGYVTIIFDGQERFELMSRIGTLINEKISSYIFKYGMENIQEARRNQNIWKEKIAQKSAEIFLTSNSRDEILEKTRNAPERYLRSILKDKNGYYIVEDNLEFKSADEDHPLVKISKEIEQKIKESQDHPNFNLGERLQFLTQPPYGIYPNMVNMAIIGFALRKYVGKLYEANTGRVINETMMRDKICDLFKFFQDATNANKLEIRIGTTEEKELTEKLKELFGFDDVSSLNDTRWKIREFIKKTQFPLWSLKYLDIEDNFKNAIDQIFTLTKNIDPEIGINDIKKALEAVKNNEFDLKLACRPEKFQQGFISFLKQIESVSITEKEFEEVIDYLNRNMQEEVAQWEEEKVASKVKDWRLSKSQTPSASVSSPLTQPLMPLPIPKQEAERIRERVISKIQEFNDKDLKVFLLKILERDFELAQRLDIYL